jgi:phosphate transport system permease protein
MTSVAPALVDRPPPRGARFDPLFLYACGAAATMLLVSLGGLVISLTLEGWPAFHKFGFGFFTNVTWDPVAEVFGAAGPIVDTLVCSLMALVISLPLAFGVAVCLVEYCPNLLRRPISIAVELLAGIPSIVYGMWGLFVFAPLFAQYVQVPLTEAAPPGSIWDTLTSGVPNGANILTASIVLAIMILPYMAAVLRELLLSVPPHLRESGYGTGATSLEVVMSISLPYVRRSAIGAVMLGLGRALGETMAVTFVIGNSHDFPKSIFSSGSTIASTIANEFNEATGAMHSAALIALGVVLFIMTFAVLAIARMLLGTDKGV